MAVWHSFAIFHRDGGQGKEGLNLVTEMSAGIACGTAASACQSEGLFC